MPKAIYEGIYREIRSRIINGTYAFQEMLPTEAELTAEFGCTRNTVRRALSMLADQMFVQPIHGKGVRVIWLKGETDMLGALEEVESFGEFAKRNNAVASTEVKSFEHLICTEQLSRRLGFKVGEELIRGVRVRSLNGSARQVDHGYFLASIAKGLTPDKIPTMMNYTTLLNADSMYNTPPCWCIYMTGLVMNYLENEIGGLENMQKINAAKAKVLYDYLDGQDFYKNPVEKKYRSMMNVTFTSPDADTDKAFCAAATEAGFVNLKGHRLVGGMRASIYNAMPAEGIDKLVDFMEKFRREH